MILKKVYKIKTTHIVIFLIIFLSTIALSLAFYRGTRDRDIKIDKESSLVEYLNKRNSSLRDSLKINKEKQRLIREVITKNKQDESKQILDILNLNDSTKLQQLRSRYNY